MADPYSGSTTSGSSASTSGGNTWLSQLESFAGAGSSGLGLISGVQQGGARGDIQAATSAAKLGSQLNLYGSNVGQAAGEFGGAVSGLGNILQGIKTGGISGGAETAAGAGQLAGSLARPLFQAGVTTAGESAGLQAVGTAAGYLAVPLSIYNFAKSWQSGSTGADALSGAETGATIGTAILPGIGTLAGALIGGAAGALSSVFGGGAKDMETTEWNQLAGKFNALTPDQQSQVVFSPQQAMTNLAGTMDAKNNSPGHAQPIEQVFGRMGENNLVQQMTGAINSAISSGAISQSASPNDIYNQVVAPWLASKGASINMNERTSSGQAEGPALVQSLKSVIGAWQSGALTSSTKVGIQGQSITGLQPYGGGRTQPGMSMIQQLQQQLATLTQNFPLGSGQRFHT